MTISSETLAVITMKTGHKLNNHAALGKKKKKRKRLERRLSIAWISYIHLCLVKDWEKKWKRKRKAREKKRRGRWKEGGKGKGKEKGKKNN